MLSEPELCDWSGRKPMLEAFGQRLREVRLQARVDQVTFASWGGVKKNSQISYEAGRTAPSVEYLLQLEQYGIDIGYVLTGRHSDGSVDIAQSFLVELFGKLSAREREAVMQLLMTLAGQSVSTEELAARARKARETGEIL